MSGENRNISALYAGNECQDRQLLRTLKTTFICALWVIALLCIWGAIAEPGYRTLVIITWPLGLWLLIAIHELGHAAATWMVGWRVVAIGIGPLGYHFHNWDFAFVPRSKRTEFAGFVLPVPLRAETCTVIRNNLISAGGPAANLLLAACLFAAWWTGPLPGPEDRVDLPLVFLGLGIGSLSLGVQALLPSFSDKFSTDGDDMRSTRRLTPAEWNDDRALAYLGGALRFQVRLRDLPAWMLEEVSNSAMKLGGDRLRHFRTVIIGIVLDSPPVDVVEAREMLNDFRDLYGSCEWLDSCDAYFTAVWEGDGTKARASLWQGGYKEEIKALMLAAEAAVLAREERVAEAREKLSGMRVANRKKSVFPDHTFRDIGRQIEAILPA